MKPQISTLPSIYDEQQFKAEKYRVNYASITGIALVLLLVTRFLNLGMVWMLTKADTPDLSQSGRIRYIHHFFTGHETAKSECLELAHSPQRPGHEVHTVVVSYTTLVHPIVFVVHTKEKFSFVDLGSIIVTVGPGLHTFTFSLTGSVKKTTGTTTTESYLEKSFLLSLFRNQPMNGGVSYLVKPQGKSSLAHIPYIVYFFLPMALLFIFVGSFSKAVLTGFLYYIGLFLLFDTRRLVGLLYLDTLMEMLGVKDPRLILGIGVTGMLFLFLTLTYIGLLNWKKKRDGFKETLTVLYFILLPFFLRF